MQAPIPRKTKVAFFNFFHGGGIGQYTHELLKRLHERPELSVQLYCPPNFQWLKEANYPVRPVLFQLSSPYPLIRRLRFLLAQYLSPTRFLRAASREGTSILHFCNINHLSYPFWAGKFENAGFRTVCTAHDVKRGKAILCRSFETGQLKSFYRDCQLIFIHSKSQAKTLKQFANVPERVIRNVPLGPFRFGLEDIGSLPSAYDGTKSTGLFFGNIRDEKNLDGLLEALALAHPDTRLVVAGRPAGAGHRPIEYYQQLAEKLNISHRIEWHIRFVPDGEVAGFFRSCDWVALPYLPEFSSQSAVFNSATHYHKPILATPAPSFDELMHEYHIGALTKGFSPSHIAEGMNRIGEQCKNSDQFGFGAYLKEHTWERNAELTTKAYLDLPGIR